MNLNLNRIVHGDTLEVMADLPAESFACIVTSPPYNMIVPAGSWAHDPSATAVAGRPTAGYDGNMFEMEPSEYIEWMRDVVAAMLRLLKPGGGLWLNHRWNTSGGLLNYLTPILEGFPVRQIICWAKCGSGNPSPAHFCPTFEPVYLLTGPDWRLPPGATGYGTVWRMDHPRRLGEDVGCHPAAFPIALPYRAIECTSIPGPVLDPFMGSGTTGVAAVRHGRDWLGIDSAAVYVTEATERIRLEEATARLFDGAGHAPEPESEFVWEQDLSGPAPETEGPVLTCR